LVDARGFGIEGPRARLPPFAGESMTAHQGRPGRARQRARLPPGAGGSMTAPSRAGIVAVYFLYFAVAGVLLPFLPGYFRGLSLSATEIGALLAVGPGLALVAPPIWAHLADRTGHPERVLLLLGLGAFAGLALLLVARSFGPILAALCAYAFFATGVAPMVDSLAIRRTEVAGGSYARLRLFGSLGFVVSSTAFGLAAEEMGSAVVVTALSLVAGWGLASIVLQHGGGVATSRTRPLAGLRLLRERDLALLLAASSVHWIACAPYHGSLSLHVLDLGLAPWVVGVCSGVGVTIEVAVMFFYPRFAERLRPHHVLEVAFFGSAVRWAGMALTSDPAAMVLLSLLHGLTFGAYYVASVEYLARRVPPELRATGQGLLVAITFGLGGLVGYVGGGAGYDLLGGHRLFAVAAVLEVAAAVLALGVRAPDRPRARISG
jgi:PPP family 3-phenylpropionic acid transporter